MKTVTLDWLDLSYYKCFKHFGQGFRPDKAFIVGKNGIGKSTLMDAYFDVLTGKLADGTAPDSVRPVDTGDSENNSPDVSREVQLLINGQKVTLTKITKQKWRRPRGSQTPIYDGNETSYTIDGFSESASSFAQKVAGLIAPADVLLYCSNARPFLNLNTVERRKVLERLSGFSLADFIKAHPEYSAVSQMLSGHTAEDVLKKLRKQLAQQKKLADAKMTELRYEQSRAVADIDVAAIEDQKKAIQAQIDALAQREKELDELAKGVDSKASKLREMERKYAELERALHDAAKSAYYALLTDRDANRRRVEELNDRIKALNDRLNRLQIDLDTADDERAEYAVQWNQVAAKQFDDSEKVCAYCGQPLPGDRVADLIAHFNAGKQKHLDRIVEQGKQAALRKDKATEEIRKTQIQLEEAKGVLATEMQSLCDIQKKVDEMSVTKTEETDEMLALSDAIEAMQASIADEEYDPNERSMVRAEATELYSKLSELTARVKAHDMAVAQQKALVERLTKEQRDLAQAAADIERDIDLIGAFSRAKNEALADLVNGVMHGFRFSLLDYTIDGNPVETCKIIGPGGVEYAGLNQSTKYIVEAELVRGFQRMQDLCLPIWMDETESIDVDRIPEMDTQMLYIRHGDNNTLYISDEL